MNEFSSLMRPRVVIVGAGLGGCVLASEIADLMEVTMVETLGSVDHLSERIKDISHPATLKAHIGAGLGGTTELWHNGLIEIEESIFSAHWPFAKEELVPWYERAYPLLGGVDRHILLTEATKVRKLYADAGIKSSGSEAIYYPAHRRNLWQTLALKEKVRLVRGEVVEIGTVDNNDSLTITSISVACASSVERVDGDIFVFAAGGLGTPLLLQRLAQRLQKSSLNSAGMYYEDHPSAVVGLVTLKKPVYKFWNLKVKSAGGRLRLPILKTENGTSASFQFRPAAVLRETQKETARSLLTELRNKPWQMKNYFKLLLQVDDVMDILSFKFGIQLPTKHYCLLMLGEQPPSPIKAVYRDDKSAGKSIVRDWRMPAEYIADLQKVIDSLVQDLGPELIEWKPFSSWPSTIDTSAHHSGTARMSSDPSHGVTDAFGKVHDISNLYVADASAIPASGTSNTGLTIAALSLRLANTLKTSFK
jgi:hypothetical protein